MGEHFSTMTVKEESTGGVHESSETNIQAEPNMEGFQQIDKSRWADLMYSLQSIAKLQSAATRARIEARQKRREATFKRQDVWIWDAKFMGEIQRLNAQGKLQGFEELSRLAAECQNSRDLLGPLEQDSIEAESRWQGQIWKLKEVEEEFYTYYEDEFKEAEEIYGDEESSTQTTSDSESQPSITPETKDKNMQTEKATSPIIIPENEKVEEPTPLELTYGDRQDFGDPDSWSDLDSGFGDIDSILGTTPLKVNDYGLPKALPRRRRSGIELYQELLEDFSTRRERVNKWLENNALESRLESLSLYSVLQELLELENQKMPSNWANLVVAYWELDEASKPISEPEHGEQDHGTVNNTQPENSNTNTKDIYEDQQFITTKPTESTQPDLNMLPKLQPASQQVNASRSGEDRSVIDTFSDRDHTPPTPIPPSPPDSHSNSRCPSRDTRGEKKPP